MLQCQIWGKGTGNALRVGGTHSRDTGEKERGFCRSCSVSQPGFFSQSCKVIQIIKLN